MNPGRRAAVSAGALAAVALVGGCSITGTTSYGSGPATPLTVPSSSESSTINGSQSAGKADTLSLQLVAEDTGALGEVVMDGRGWILYRFDKDRTTRPRPSCVGACAEKWPPVLVSGAPILHGVSSSIVGKVQLPDGSWQL